MKINIILDSTDFEYDIYSLIKAFYPHGDLKAFEKDKETRECDLSFYVKEEGEKISFYRDSECLNTKEIPEDHGAGDSDSISDRAHARAERKNIYKSLIYEALAKELGPLPWGDLTGIRPTKIARVMLEEGKSESEAKEKMIDSYYVSEEKAALSVGIAREEIKLLSGIDKGSGYSLYIGIPFCPTTCLYCSFTSNSIAVWKKRVPEYLNALKKEISYVADAFKDKTLDTVYIGGGTPTTLTAGELDDLISFMEEKLDLSHLLEFTVEAGRADSITADRLKVLKDHNVTRISVNPQTMNQETLDLIGRRHTVEDVVRAFNDARDAGFTNINMDIILGLPGEREPEVKNTLDRIVSLKPDSLTVHSLAVKRGSKMHERIVLNGYETMFNTDETMKLAANAAKELDMVPYYLYRQKNMAGNFENVGYARPGSFGIYNILIMEEVEPIVALGPGSVSKVLTSDNRIERCDNVKDVSLYIENIDEMIERKKALFSLMG